MDPTPSEEASNTIEQHGLEASIGDFSRSATHTWATPADIDDMHALGLHPTFKRRFKFVAMVAFSSMVTVAWQNLAAVFQFALYDGGIGGLFWGFLFSMVGMGLVYLSLAELSSA